MSAERLPAHVELQIKKVLQILHKAPQLREKEEKDFLIFTQGPHSILWDNAALDDAEIQKRMCIFQNMSVRVFKSGDILAQGPAEQPLNYFYILEGSVLKKRDRGSNAIVTVRTLKAGEHLGFVLPAQTKKQKPRELLQEISGRSQNTLVQPQSDNIYYYICQSEEALVCHLERNAAIEFIKEQQLEIRNFLKQNVALFELLSDGDIKHVSRNCRRKRFAKGEWVFREEDQFVASVEHFYIIKEGTFSLAMLGVGEFFGEEDLLTQPTHTQRSFGVQCEGQEGAEVLCVNGQVLRELIAIVGGLRDALVQIQEHKKYTLAQINSNLQLSLRRYTNYLVDAGASAKNATAAAQLQRARSRIMLENNSFLHHQKNSKELPSRNKLLIQSPESQQQTVVVYENTRASAQETTQNVLTMNMESQPDLIPTDRQFQQQQFQNSTKSVQKLADLQLLHRYRLHRSGLSSVQPTGAQNTSFSHDRSRLSEEAHAETERLSNQYKVDELHVIAQLRKKMQIKARKFKGLPEFKDVFPIEMNFEEARRKQCPAQRRKNYLHEWRQEGADRGGERRLDDEEVLLASLIDNTKLGRSLVDGINLQQQQQPNSNNNVQQSALYDMLRRRIAMNASSVPQRGHVSAKIRLQKHMHSMNVARHHFLPHILGNSVPIASEVVVEENEQPGLFEPSALRKNASRYSYALSHPVSPKERNYRE